MNVRKRWAGGLLIAVLLSGAPSFASELLSIQGQQFIDQKGRVVVLRGVNASAQAKSPPFVTFSKGPSELARLPKWGINLVRLLVIWEALEPVRGTYDEKYLDQLQSLVDEAQRLGLYVILDLHQDGYSRFIGSGCGSGFPEWAVPRDLKRNPRSVPKCGSWGIKMAISRKMSKAFHRFYADRDGVRTSYLQATSKLASRFKGHSAVIGYDLLNEPWGNEVEEIQPLYTDMARVIHDQDPTAFILIEPRVFMTTFGLRDTNLQKPEFKNAVYAPHYYNPLVATLHTWKKPMGGIETMAFNKFQSKADELGLPLLIGEFGAPGETKNVGAFFERWHGLALGTMASMAQWTYSPDWTPASRDGWNHEDLSIVDDTGRLRSNADQLPYLQKLAGTLIHQFLERDERMDTLHYQVQWDDPGPGQTAPTEIFVPNNPGWGSPWETRSMTPDLKCSYDYARAVLICSSPTPGPKSIELLSHYGLTGTVR